jgi:NADPH-dependent glutamate synthase beta subunit-like oxidoreductase
VNREKIILSVEIPDKNYWRRLVSCQDACPVHTDARGYVRAIAEGNYELAFRIARGPNPLASICGRVCQAPCEEACRRSVIDDPISIRALKRFTTEQCGAETKKGTPLSVVESVRMITSANSARDELYHIVNAQAEGKLPRAEGQKVIIIGGGPAGLSCAHDLSLFGFSPVIFEMESKPAGMLYTGIPEFRLPREVIDAEIKTIENLGVKMRCGTTVGKDIQFDEILREFSATVISVGAKHSRGLNIPGEDALGVHGGVEFLRTLSLGKKVKLGKQVVVIGGGFTAMDCSRSSLRSGVSDVVTVLYRRTRDEMPVSDLELEEASEEGVEFKYLVTPLAIEKDTDGNVTGVRLQKNRLGPPDASGRRRPEPIPGSEFLQPCDTLIRAIGQQTDLSFIDDNRDGLTFNEWGLIDCDEETLATKVPEVFMAGDAAYGTRLVIDAVASGKKAARSVYHHLIKHPIVIETTQTHEDLGIYTREIGFESIPRTVVPRSEKDTRIADHNTSVELGYDERRARLEASRCLDCGINTIFDGQKCILCGGCVDICPTRCLKLVPLADLNLTEPQEERAVECIGNDWKQGSAIIKDEEACIRCGLCARWCPPKAITMERMHFSEEWS